MRTPCIYAYVHTCARHICINAPTHNPYPTQHANHALYQIPTYKPHNCPMKTDIPAALPALLLCCIRPYPSPPPLLGCCLLLGCRWSPSWMPLVAVLAALCVSSKVKAETGQELASECEALYLESSAKLNTVSRDVLVLGRGREWGRMTYIACFFSFPNATIVAAAMRRSCCVEGIFTPVGRPFPRGCA